MADTFDIPKYKRGDALHAATINALTDEVRKLNRVRTGSGLSARMGAGGLALGVAFPDTGPITAVVATGGITARVSSTTLGEGNAVLWPRTTGTATIAAGDTVKVYSGFGTLIPAGTYIEVLPEANGDYKLVGADCPA